MMASSLFAANITAKQSQLRHDLHSLKKGNLSIRAYVDKIKSMCALLAASGSPILEAERTSVLLAGLSSDFDAIMSSASLSSGPVPFQRLMDALLECEARQMRTIFDVLVAANFVEGSSSPAVDGSSRGGRSPGRGRGCSFRTLIQCQICSRYGHIAQRFFYRYHRDDQHQHAAPMPYQGDSALGANEESWPDQNWMHDGQNWMGLSRGSSS